MQVLQLLLEARNVVFLEDVGEIGHNSHLLLHFALIEGESVFDCVHLCPQLYHFWLDLVDLVLEAFAAVLLALPRLSPSAALVQSLYVLAQLPQLHLKASHFVAPFLH